MITLTYNEIEGQRGVSSATVDTPADSVSDWVLAPRSVHPLTITVTPGAGGMAQCEITTARVWAVDLGMAYWQPWGAGFVAETTMDALQSPVVALRLVATDAPASMDIVAGD